MGARIKNESKSVQHKILTAVKRNELEASVIEKSDGVRLIVTYSHKRAKKDANNRKKGIDRLNAQIRSGRLTKCSLNKRGYNKFLVLQGDVQVTIDKQ